VRTLDQALDLLASRGDAVAFRRRTEFRSFPLTGRQAAARALRIAAVLKRTGVGPGDRVVVRGPNGPDWGLSLLAILRLGAVAVPLDARASLDFTRRIAETTGAKAAVLSRLGAPGPSGLPTLLMEEIDARIAAEDGPDPPPPTVSPDDTAEILFTSGTTGAPKGVVLTHGNVAANAADLVRLAPMGPRDVFLSLLPLSHMFEQTVGFFVPIDRGACVVYLDTLKPSAVVRALKDERVTLAVVVPRILKGLQQGIERETATGPRGAYFRAAWAAAGPLPTAGRRVVFTPLRRGLGGRLRFFYCGGAPLEPDTEAFWERLGFPILQGWGLTETSPVLACARPDARRAGSVGRFLDTVEHRFGPDGEILVKGPSVFRGYLDDPRRTKEVFDDGWFRTGDLGELRDGFLFLKGRSKDLIKTPGGLNVYPEDVEAALRAVDGVRDACVFGMKGDRGEEVAAALLPWPGRALDPRAVVAAANGRLEEGRGAARAFVWPGEDFPRTPTLKVKKFQVKEAVEKGALSEGKVAASGPEDPILALLVKLCRRAAEEIEDSHRLGPDLGLDSLDLVDLVSSLEERLNLDIDEGDVAPETTVGTLREMVRARKPVDPGGLPAWPRSWWGGCLRWAFRRLLLFPLFRVFVRNDVRGLEHLEGLDGPVIFAPNHLSHIDTPAILLALPAARRRRTGAAAWKEYWEPPGAGLLKRAFLQSLRLTLTVGIPMVPMAQTRAYRRSLRGVGTMLDAGWSLIFFPEGERSRTGERLPFRQGIGIVAGAMRARVVPVRLEGFHVLLPRDAFLPRRGTGKVIFGKPLTFPPDADPAKVAREVEEAVDALATGPGLGGSAK
jgi:long-chain acyl-CoA synthetase